MFRRIKLAGVFAAFFLTMSGCGSKVAPPTWALDSPAYHYRNGLTNLDSNQFGDAMKSFERTTVLDPKSPLGYVGKGLAFGKQGDFKAAFANMETAKDHETAGIESAIGMIRILSMQRAEGWVAKAEKEFKAAREKEAGSAPLRYHMAMAYKVSFDFDKAADLFEKVVNLNQEFTAEANAEWATIRKIQRAAPGTIIGKQIALIDKIDRADIAALFVQELELEKFFTRRGTRNYDTSSKPPAQASATKMTTETVIRMEAATDIKDHWLKSSIDIVLKLGIRGLEPGPDHTFEPDRLIKRSEFALMLEDILVKVSGNEKLATKYVGATSLFPDLRSDHYSFNAVMVVTSRGFMDADKATGEFRPGEAVSGADALLSIHELKNQLKI